LTCRNSGSPSPFPKQHQVSTGPDGTDPDDPVRNIGNVVVAQHQAALAG
jgi:hypothetical protein